MTELDAFASRAASMSWESFARRDSTMGVLWVACVVVAEGASAFAVLTAPLAGAGDESAPCLRSKATAHPLVMGPADGNGGEQETEAEAPSEEGDDPTALGGGANGASLG